jgi:ParB family chromosome partitioning protein
MASTLIKVRPENCDFPSQPRSSRDPEYCRGVGESMKTVGQQVPIIGYTDPGTRRFNAYDGGCRIEGAKLCGIPELLALDLGKAPTPLELQMAQASIDIHKKHFPPMDRARLWHGIIQKRGCTAKQLAKELGVSDSLIGDYLSLLTLPLDVQDQVNSGALHMSKGRLIAQVETDPDRQRELAALAKNMSRSKVVAQARERRRNEQQTPVVKVSRVRIDMPHGASVVISQKDLSMSEVVELLTETLKEARKAAAQYDVKTWTRMMADKAKAGS